MNGLTGGQLAQTPTELTPKSEMRGALDSLFVELDSLSAHIANLEGKLIPVLIPMGDAKTSNGSAIPLTPEAPFLTQLRNARSQVMSMSERLEKLRDNLVV